MSFNSAAVKSLIPLIKRSQSPSRKNCCLPAHHWVKMTKTQGRKGWTQGMTVHPGAHVGTRHQAFWESATDFLAEKPCFFLVIFFFYSLHTMSKQMNTENMFASFSWNHTEVTTAIINHSTTENKEEARNGDRESLTIEMLKTENASGNREPESKNVPNLSSRWQQKGP